MERRARRKDKIAAGLFGLFLGTLGLHHFYLGSPGSGLIYLLLTVLTCGLLSVVGGIVEGFLLLFMTDEEFDERYTDRRPEPVEFVFSRPRGSV